MTYKTTYVLPLLDGWIYFQSLWHEDEEFAANRFFKMHTCQFNSFDQTSNFFEANTDLHFSCESSVERTASIRDRQYILNKAGGLTAKFYDFSQSRWRISYQGSWLLFVNQFATISDPLYGFKLSGTDAKECFLTLTEAKLLTVTLRIQALTFKELEHLRADAHFIENQINTLKERAIK